ncbi:type VII toxin-antitoxin system HepT family RNase toxin [Salsuginibacillus halophilus]|nr:DUF86 domain-containing protein [Salsuginibacillus halophilus]
MYFVDREVIETTLEHTVSITEACGQIENVSEMKEALALERAVHIAIECIIDVGNQMIDGFIMRDPGSYEDIVEILRDEAVVSSEEAAQLTALVRWRKALVHHYTSVDHNQLKDVVTTNEKALRAFPERVRSYLEHELGPVSAFLPKDKESRG